MEDNFTTAITQLSARQHQFLGDQRLISNQSNIWLPSSGAVAYSNYLMFTSFFVRKGGFVVVTQPDNLCIHLWLFVTDYLICLDDYLFCLDVQIAERERQSSVMHYIGGGWGGGGGCPAESGKTMNQLTGQTHTQPLDNSVTTLMEVEAVDCFLLYLCFDLLFLFQIEW